MPIRANGKYSPPYRPSVGTCAPSNSREKRKKARQDVKIATSVNAKLRRYDAAWRKSRTRNAQTLRSVAAVPRPSGAIGAPGLDAAVLAGLGRRPGGISLVARAVLGNDLGED